MLKILFYNGKSDDPDFCKSIRHQRNRACLISDLTFVNTCAVCDGLVCDTIHFLPPRNFFAGATISIGACSSFHLNVFEKGFVLT